MLGVRYAVFPDATVSVWGPLGFDSHIITLDDHWTPGRNNVDIPFTNLEKCSLVNFITFPQAPTKHHGYPMKITFA